MNRNLKVMIMFLMTLFAFWVIYGTSLIIQNNEPSNEKVDYTISISNGIVTVRNVDNNEVIGRNVLDSLSVIIINDNK